VVVSGGNIGEMAMHFLEKYGLMAIRIPSKFDLRRFCRATGSVALVKLQTPQPDELGFAKQVRLCLLCWGCFVVGAALLLGLHVARTQH
jgi:T-complex protein 1 subunit theta